MCALHLSYTYTLRCGLVDGGLVSGVRKEKCSSLVNRRHQQKAPNFFLLRQAILKKKKKAPNIFLLRPSYSEKEEKSAQFFLLRPSYSEKEEKSALLFFATPKLF